MVSRELLEEFNFEEEVTEIASFRKGPWAVGGTGFPKPDHRYQLILESFNQSIEESYFWVLDHLKHTLGFPEIEKITDIFAASEQSSFFGVAWQRVGLQQDKVSQFLATVGKMVKELFQLVRELRIIDERLTYYYASIKREKGWESAEITLKGIWIDLVEQGSKNPSSVYGMARELHFITLPDLFFSIHPQTGGEVDGMVDKLVQFNRKVREVLKRKLRSYIEWKKQTKKELEVRRRFTLKYLKQHFDIIRMYISWVKPYLKNIKRLQTADRSKSPDIISAFEGSVIEIELLAKKLPSKFEVKEEPHQNKKVYTCMLINFDYRTRPQMSYQQEYQRGPLHLGRLQLTMRGYAWSEEEINRYIKMKEKEDMQLIMDVDSSVKNAMEALGEELEHYLEEASKRDTREEEKAAPAPPLQSPLTPFVGVFKGFIEIFSPLIPKGASTARVKKEDQFEIGKEKELALTNLKKSLYTLYYDYKYTHGLLTW